MTEVSFFRYVFVNDFSSISRSSRAIFKFQKLRSIFFLHCLHIITVNVFHVETGKLYIEKERKKKLVMKPRIFNPLILDETYNSTISHYSGN